ncbi:MAG: EAL domain-containing protein [Myxococcales bacterium]|nr:EAL domain-containing protein [Myxococcales bacterium]MCB9581885.1 EAL domain-containing protein [Polyangiaceae bacterium]
MLEEILGRQALCVAFQPIFDLASGEVYAHEVLGRADPELLGAPAPGPLELVDLAVASDKLLDLEHGWRTAAVDAIARYSPQGDSRFFLNVDTRILSDARFVPGTTRSLLDARDLNPRRFVFELTERDPHLGARRLAELLPHYSCQGFGIALDDLGAGHASLHVMVQLRPEIVKLDREMCQDVSVDPWRKHLIHALSRFCFQTGIALVAEGIETPADLETLRSIGVRYGQGFLLGMPRPEPLPTRRRLTMAKAPPLRLVGS